MAIFDPPNPPGPGGPEVEKSDKFSDFRKSLLDFRLTF